MVAEVSFAQREVRLCWQLSSWRVEDFVSHGSIIQGASSTGGRWLRTQVAGAAVWKSVPAWRSSTERWTWTWFNRRLLHCNVYIIIIIVVVVVVDVADDARFPTSAKLQSRLLNLQATGVRSSAVIIDLVRASVVHVPSLRCTAAGPASFQEVRGAHKLRVVWTRSVDYGQPCLVGRSLGP